VLVLLTVQNDFHGKEFVSLFDLEIAVTDARLSRIRAWRSPVANTTSFL
jgi:hypothetical protein